MVASNGTCYATTPFLCGAQLTYYIDADGSYVWSVTENDDNWAGSEEVQAAAQQHVQVRSSSRLASSVVADAAASSSSAVVEGVAVGTSSSLRGAKGLIRFL